MKHFAVRWRNISRYYTFYDENISVEIHVRNLHDQNIINAMKNAV